VSDFNFRRFLFFVAFFPQLIAGPIVHHAELIQQLRKKNGLDAKRFSQGLFLFAMGLFKKTVIADRIAERVDPLFGAGDPLQLFESWTASVGYGLQIYFDFSGYSDMAIGMGLMFGLVLPQNFNSPYQAVNIADFWRRWHMTLSRFLRDYLYIPLGGNQKGFGRGILAAGVTMLLGGLWHGAAWTYVIWGLLHGLFIAIYRVWTGLGLKLSKWPAILVTWLSVTFAWVVFRATSLTQAWSIWKGMLGLNGTTVPSALRALCDNCAQTSLITGMELCIFAVLLSACFEMANAQQRADNLLPTKKHLALYFGVFLSSLWLASSHENFIYWQF
jgi:D-alanyl-lipoteichoic acid acyltransferase DltB (MBOAT superfamily)